MNHSAQQETLISMKDLDRFSVIVSEIMQTATFIADTATLLEGSEGWDGSIGNLTPFYATQLKQLVRDAANKQLSLLELLEDLTTAPINNSLPLLDVLQQPKVSFPSSEAS
ncbi:hypothetical protein [Marinimicrobium sp. ABcell2]|uniref:hypothetical protein n=1 Tax=Marinimicrobium sp. ABcell2 TaxID=3069751 RepID=UPI0027B59ED7|nr:hypothetical protein [Marinimicrobium sp. ABcell2]MDQ2076078.1 hypothetical protein [Marinimicrobium sp. ABcell2]